MEAVDIKQLESVDAGCLFAQQGIIPARSPAMPLPPPSAKQTNARKRVKRRCSVQPFPRHGLIDMASYDKYLSGDLVNYELTDADIQKNLDEQAIWLNRYSPY